MHEAFYVAANGRPGPVVVDLPKIYYLLTLRILLQKMLGHVHINLKRMAI